MDQLNLEKKGIPTVTIATTAFAEVATATMQQQAGVELALVVVEHPIAGHNMEDIRAKANAAFPDILQAATAWQPAGE